MQQKIVVPKLDEPDLSLISKGLALFLARSIVWLEKDILKTLRLQLRHSPSNRSHPKQEVVLPRSPKSYNLFK